MTVGAVALGVVLAATSCAGLPQLPGTGQQQAPSTSAAPIGPPEGREELRSFYTQQLTWEPCEKAQCAWLTVPVDYAKPAGETMRLRLLKVSARGASKGPLFVNPGGPGGSATAYAALASLIVSGRVRESYDVVGLDPRGVGQSNPIVCLDPPAMDGMLGADPTPDTPAEEAEAERLARDFGKACQQRYPQLLPHVSTVDAAKDMDIARAVLGQQQMTYLGKSYGTYLGSIYADLFPHQVGRLVLDGAMAPDLTDKELSLGQAEGFERATRAYVESCVKGSGCPLGSDADAGMKALASLLTQLDRQPLPVDGDPRVKELTEGWAQLGVASSMYSEDAWPRLTAALRDAKAGDGTALFELARAYSDRTDKGEYSGNTMQVINAVNCLDHPATKLTPEQLAAQREKFRAVAPTWGPFMSGPSSTCLNWPVPASATPKKVAATGADPILVVGTTRDPATPYEWAQRLAKQLDKGRLVTYDGDGHTAYMRSNACVNRTVDDYLIDGTVPGSDVSC